MCAIVSTFLIFMFVDQFVMVRMGGPLALCRLKFSYFVGSRLKFWIFVACR